MKVIADVVLKIEIDTDDFDSTGEMEWAMIKEIAHKVESGEWDVPDDWPMHYTVHLPSGVVTSLD